MSAASSYETLVPVDLIGSAASGHVGRRKKKLLSRIFFAYSRNTMQITGAFLLVACWATGVVRDEVHWKCDRYVSLAEPARLAPSDVQWNSTLVHLKPDAELRVRNSRFHVKSRILLIEFMVWLYKLHDNRISGILEIIAFSARSLSQRSRT